MELVRSVHPVYIIRIPSLKLSLTSPLGETTHPTYSANLASFGARDELGKKESREVECQWIFVTALNKGM
jgi:hypothetical protein